MTLSTRKSLHGALLAAACSLLFAMGAAQADDAADVMAVAKAQWAAENQNKPSSQTMVSIADDYTEFNPQLPTLLEGKAIAGRFYDASLQAGDKGLVSEMVNPHVQVYGDTAILTYNYAGMTKGSDGKIRNNFAKSTRVYVKQNGRWMLVHANFAPVVAGDDS